MSRPLSLIPWQTDFMPALADMIVLHDNLSKLIVLFPHNRPRRHLKGLLSGHPDLSRPVFMPQMVSIADFVSGLHRQMAQQPPMRANQLDLVETLHQIVIDLGNRSGSLLSRLPELDREAFLPWGVRLVKLMDDLLRQDVTPQDLSYMEGEVSPYAAALLGQLSEIHAEYTSRLHAKGWTTSGLDARFAVENTDSLIESLEGKTIIAAGFYALSGAEDELFKTLWEAGILHPIIHSDPALAEGMPHHWAAAEHVAWLKRWRTSASIPDGVSITPRAPTIEFCEGYDRHSQLDGLGNDMKQAGTLEESAVVLPDEGALLPVLHMLPDVEPNISMGYPLDRTSLARLLETLLTLQENRNPDGRYYWKDVVALIRHPYLRLLGPDDRPLRTLFHVWESTIRTGEKFIDPLEWEPPFEEEQLSDVDRTVAAPLLKTILYRCLTVFESTDTLFKLGEALGDLAELLHAQGEKLWHTYLIDAECLFRLTSSVIPQLKGAETSHEIFSRSTLHSFLRRMLSQERVSFEPDPLAGLQVLGVLETRLLHFKHLYILDAVEDRLPGTNPYDPLLPDPLRKLLGLPDARERDNVSGYNFYRLLMGAEKAIIYYQNGVQPGLLDSGSVRSRFVEQLLWEREAQNKRLTDSKNGLIRAVTFPASSLPSSPGSIAVTDAIREALITKLTSKGLSPSGLDRYMTCPKQFFYQYLTGIRPVDQVDEEGDRSEFGSLIHEVLKEFLTPFIGVPTELSKLDPAPLLGLFNDMFTSSGFFSRLPLDARLALAETGRYRLTKFLEDQPTATLIGLEHPLETAIEIDGLSIPLAGRVDRIDRRDSGVVILDYKTGNAELPKKSFWQDMELLDRLESYGPDVIDLMLLPDLSAATRSIQLPAYMHLYARSEKESPSDAGLIKLASNGAEQLLFGSRWTDEERIETVKDHIPILIQAVIRHMVQASHFTPNPGANCRWCDYKTPCGQ